MLFTVVAGLFASISLAFPRPEVHSLRPDNGQPPFHGPSGHSPGGYFTDHDGDQFHNGHNRAVYFLRVDPAGSEIVAIQLNEEGHLTSTTSRTSTRGQGLQSLNATAADNSAVAADPLQGQQAVSIGDNYLFTINSGSNTAIMFRIDPWNPLQLEMVGSPVPTLGEFPMSVAYTTKHQKACVLNGGVVNGLTCFDVDAQKGLVADGLGLREFGFSSTTPPELGGPKGSGSDVQFSGDSSKVLVTFKGDNMPADLGHIAVFSVDQHGRVATDYADNRFSPLSGVFGFALDGNDPQHFLVSGIGFGAALLSLDYSTNQVLLLSTINDTAAFKASCWAVYSYDTNMFYDIDAATTNIGKISVSGELSGILSYDKSLGGGFDTVVEGPLSYILTATNKIAVLDLASGVIRQEYIFGDPDDRPFWTGMAIYPASPLLSGGGSMRP